MKTLWPAARRPPSLALLQIDPEVVGISIRRFRQDALKQAQGKILWYVEVQFVYARDVGMRMDLDVIQRVRADAQPDKPAPSAKARTVEDEIEASRCR